jgi:hypothetical protein
MNEASWLRTYTGYDVMNVGSGLSLPDNANSTTSGQYQAAIKQMVSDLNALGVYVILDLHWSAPDGYLGNTQMQLPDTSHSIDFWTSVATYFGDNPGVIFDLFNEPYPGSPSPGSYTEAQIFNILLNGAAQTEMDFNGGGSPSPISHTWTGGSAGMQALVTAVRNTGAINLLLVGGANACGDLSGFLTANGGYFPTDPLNNIAASWHAYSVSSSSTTVNAANFGGSINPTTIANDLLAQGIPVVITETGGNAGVGATNPDPVTLYATQWADANSYQGHAIAWTWNNWYGGSGIAQDLLISNDTGGQIGGEGQTWYNWTFNHP